MKLNRKYYSPNSNDLKNGVIYYDDKLAKGLYVAGRPNYVKRNVKLLDIEYQIPDTKEQAGVKFSYQYNMVLLTIVILDDNSMQKKIQFILTDDCTDRDIYFCKHYILDGFKDMLMRGLDLLKVKTLDDAITWTENQ